MNSDKKQNRYSAALKRSVVGLTGILIVMSSTNCSNKQEVSEKDAGSITIEKIDDVSKLRETQTVSPADMDLAESAEEKTEQMENTELTKDTKQAEKEDVSGIYTDKQGTDDVYSQLTLALQPDGSYAVEISVYRTIGLEGTAVWEGDTLRFTSEDPYVLADISVTGSQAEVMVITDTAGVLTGDTYSFPDGAPEEYPEQTGKDASRQNLSGEIDTEMTTEQLLDLFINGSISAISSEDSAFYITDLDMDSGEWDSYSIGERADLDNDGENELIICGPYGGIYLDARDGKVYEFAVGEGDSLVLSYVFYNGSTWIMYSNRMHTGYEAYHMEKFEGADDLVAEMNFHEELVDEDNVEGKEKYTLNGTEISYDEYFELCSKIFATEVITTK